MIMTSKIDLPPRSSSAGPIATGFNNATQANGEEYPKCNLHCTTTIYIGVIYGAALILLFLLFIAVISARQSQQLARHANSSDPQLSRLAARRLKERWCLPACGLDEEMRRATAAHCIGEYGRARDAGMVYGVDLERGTSLRGGGDDEDHDECRCCGHSGGGTNSPGCVDWGCEGADCGDCDCGGCDCSGC